jgi:hypothetical protein
MDEEGLGSLGGMINTEEQITLDESEFLMEKNVSEWRKVLAADILKDLIEIAKAKELFANDDWIRLDELLELLLQHPSGRWQRNVLPSGKLTGIDLSKLLLLIGVKSVRFKKNGGQFWYYNKSSFTERS